MVFWRKKKTDLHRTWEAQPRARWGGLQDRPPEGRKRRPGVPAEKGRDGVTAEMRGAGQQRTTASRAPDSLAATGQDPLQPRRPCPFPRAASGQRCCGKGPGRRPLGVQMRHRRPLAVPKQLGQRPRLAFMITPFTIDQSSWILTYPCIKNGGNDCTHGQKCPSVLEDMLAPQEKGLSVSLACSQVRGLKPRGWCRLYCQEQAAPAPACP